MNFFIIFALLFSVCHANNSFNKNKPSHWCNLPYGYVEQSSVRGFNFMEHYKNLSLENIVEVIDGIIYTEEWKDITGYEELYQISSFGRVYSFPKPRAKQIITFNKEKILKPTIRKGYAEVGIVKDREPKIFRIHRLVGMSFIENQFNKPEINHVDGIKLNNFYLNLEWVTRKENSDHAIKNGLCKYLGENHYLSKFKNSDILYIRASNLSSIKLAKEYSVNSSTIDKIRNKLQWKHIE